MEHIHTTILSAATADMAPISSPGGMARKPVETRQAARRSMLVRT
jgi:hypothetical protein